MSGLEFSRRGVLAVAVAAALLQVDAGAAAARPGPSPEPVLTELKQARESGEPVEVTALTTEREKRFVNPDGSWTLEQHIEPVRVRQKDDSWVAVDTRLRVVDGRVRPVAAIGGASFSTGGNTPMAELDTGYGRLALSWPGDLPAPALSGDSATYAEVLPGVDLVLRATADGFSHVLVVRNRAAAENPALRELRFGFGGGDLDLTTKEDGDLAAVTPGGTVTTSAGKALMWDSTTDAGTPGSSVTTAGDGAHRASPPMRVEGEDLVIEPDQALLTGPGVTYPVYIDPSFAKGAKPWAFANSANENNDATVMRVGLSPESGATYRSYATFDVAALRGRRIFDAKLQTLLVHSWDCAATPVNLYRVDSAGSGRLGWSGPALAEWVDQRSGNAHKGGNDCGNQPDQPMEFSNRLTTEVAEGAAQNKTALSLAFSARQSNGGGENTQSWWKKFAPSSVKLVVIYNSVPTTPTSLSAEGRGCGTGTSRPVTSSLTPKLRAVVSDPDSDEVDLRASFAWERWTGSAWQAMGSGQQTNLRPRAGAEVRIGSGLVHGGIYRWRAQTLDPWSYNGVTGTDPSPWSGYCEFEVDTQGPAAAPKVSSTVYGSDLNQTYGAVGLTADFTFNAAGAADVAGYLWGWADEPTTRVDAPGLGAAVTVPLTPPPLSQDDPTTSGLITLYVVSVDRAGTSSPKTEYTFRIGAPTEPVGVWEMAEPAGSTTLADTNQRGTAHPATLTAGTAGAPGRLLDGPGKQAPKSVNFNGTSSYAATTGPVVDTSKSLSVSAWVRLTSAPTPYHTAVIQKGTHTSGFFLTFDHQRWAFATHSADAAGATASLAVSATPVALHRWTHVLGVYDAGARQLRIYVNGELTGTANRTGTPWHANGPLWIGRGFSGDTAPTSYLPGDIAEVRVWDRVVSEPEAGEMAATLVGNWELDGNGADATPYARDLSVGAGTVGWTEGVRRSAASIPTGQSWLATAGPVVRTTQSYTVAAWVRASRTGNYQTILCQHGAVRCAFYLQYSLPHDRWALVLPTSDNPPVDAYHSVTSKEPPGDDEWVHLTGVYNASSGVLRFYVNGVQEGYLTAVPGMWQAAGPLRVGFMDAGQVAGAIDRVRVYAGVLSPNQIRLQCGCGQSTEAGVSR